MERAQTLKGSRWVLEQDDPRFPAPFLTVRDHPERLFGIGDPSALEEGLAIVGARKATPYGLSCARKFARLAAEKDIVIISGGARGCDAEAHEAALRAGGRTVSFLGGGCDQIYPRENRVLFQRIVDTGGAIVSEQEWEMPPRRYMFRERNRLIASLAKATLIVEAGLPSGTFSTADEALGANRDLLVVPGAITSDSSLGCNRLIYQGAIPIIDDETFFDALFSLFVALRHPSLDSPTKAPSESEKEEDLVRALRAEPLTLEELIALARQRAGDQDPYQSVMIQLARLQQQGKIARYADGRYGPVVLS